jgi:hypothetical protein
MLRDRVRAVAKATVNKIRIPLFSIELRHTSSLYLAIDSEIIYGGEIYQTEPSDSSNDIYMSLICSDHAKMQLQSNTLRTTNIVIKVGKQTYCFESFFSLIDINPLDDEMWDIGISIREPSKILKV